ncbi:MAG: AAA family ATPase [Bacteroidales bacterium]
MKLKAFRIKNYRSIIDTGWCYLANDNITVLIGQNESGKTSILEGLRSFFTGNISDEVLRSDLTLPEVYCQFEFENQNIQEIIDFNKIPAEAEQSMKSISYLTISRKWDEIYNSTLRLENDYITDIFIKKHSEKQSLYEETQSLLDKIYNEYQSIDEKKQYLVKQKNKLSRNIEEYKSILKSQKRKASKSKRVQEKQKEMTEQIENLESSINAEQEKYNNINEKLQEYEEQLKSIELKKEIAESVKETKKQYELINHEIQKLYEELKETEATFHLLNPQKEKSFGVSKLQNIKTLYLDSAKKMDNKRKEYEYWLRIGAKIIDGKDYNLAVQEVKEDIEKEEEYYTLEDIGEIIFKHAPSFEFFHDFSSLLPDTIDLEDLIVGKEDVKGYKAVRNYLEVANLKPDFFDQKNSRILKQKIEKLNKDITVDFHEYWRQCIGYKNKIQISFELEHYDHNTPEKLGKPYIEFWIKDKEERLYPKQRSRGVRWFLSFYLELKAFAKRNNRKRILLIDEPAMSLHARAQEDVLKVFEDIKNELQVIYTTHSPHLVDVNKLYRILALQRNDDNGSSETVVFDANSFERASFDTLSPIYSVMGARLNEQKFIQAKNNIIIEDITTYYYLKAISKLTGRMNELYFIPATDTSYVITMVNLLLGWQLEFMVILGNNKKALDNYKFLKHNLFRNNDEIARKNIIQLENNMKQIEDMFSTIDFKKFILKDRIGITESNSDYIKNNNLSRPILGSRFLLSVEQDNLQIDDFDDQTRENINNLIKKIQQRLSRLEESQMITE